jgi:hypothetical protein
VNHQATNEKSACLRRSPFEGPQSTYPPATEPTRRQKQPTDFLRILPLKPGKISRHRVHKWRPKHRRLDGLCHSHLSLLIDRSLPDCPRSFTVESPGGRARTYRERTFDRHGTHRGRPNRCCAKSECTNGQCTYRSAARFDCTCSILRLHHRSLSSFELVLCPDYH